MFPIDAKIKSPELNAYVDDVREIGDTVSSTSSDEPAVEFDVLIVPPPTKVPEITKYTLWLEGVEVGVAVGVLVTVDVIVGVIVKVPVGGIVGIPGPQGVPVEIKQGVIVSVGVGVYHVPVGVGVAVKDGAHGTTVP